MAVHVSCLSLSGQYPSKEYPGAHTHPPEERGAAPRAMSPAKDGDRGVEERLVNCWGWG